jgi:hypothetical protein
MYLVVFYDQRLDSNFDSIKIMVVHHAHSEKDAIDKCYMFTKVIDQYNYVRVDKIVDDHSITECFNGERDITEEMWQNKNPYYYGNSYVRGMSKK